MVTAFKWLQKYCFLVTILCNVGQIWSVGMWHCASLWVGIKAYGKPAALCAGSMEATSWYPSIKLQSVTS